MGSNLNPMAKPFHIGSSMLNVEFILSLPKECSTFTLSLCLYPFEPLPLSYIQNKPNLRKAQISVTSVTIKNYEENRPPNPRKNKPNSNPIKPNYKKAKMNVNKVLTKDYENKRLCRRAENKPNFKLFAGDIIHELRYVADRRRMDYNHYRPHNNIRGQCNVY